MKRKGWFKIDGSQNGDRTLTEQMVGLRPLVHMVAGKTVLDVGCAEGLISTSLASVGARRVHGIDIVPDHIAVANSLKGDWPCFFDVADANTYQPRGRYDIVVMLAVLHKLANPSAACLRFADAAIESCVIRLPPDGQPVKPMDHPRGPCSFKIIEHAMFAGGFRLNEMAAGPRGEHVFYWGRR